MTSLLISAFARLQSSSPGADLQKKQMDDSCTFCAIVAGQLPAFKVYEDDSAMAFLDILPIRAGHTLLIPKAHHRRMYIIHYSDIVQMTDLPGDVSAHMAKVLPRLCRAVCKAADQPDFNLVSNNGYAQVVDHVHWHIVPAPRLNDRSTLPESTKGPTGLQEIRRRNELDDDEAEDLAKRIRIAIVTETAKGRSRL